MFTTSPVVVTFLAIFALLDMFFIVVISLFLSLNSYLFVRGWQALMPNLTVGILFSSIFGALSLILITRMVKGDTLSPSLSPLVSDIAFTWFAALLYLSLFAILVDLFRVLLPLLPTLSQWVGENSISIKRALFAVALLSFFLFYYIGNRNFNRPKVTKVVLNIDKPNSKKEVKVVFCSDLHLSSYINDRHLKKYVELINSERADLLLIGGDIVDRDLAPLKEWDALAILKEIKTAEGVYAIEGNHEYYGGEREDIKEYLERANIKILRDSSVTVAGKIQIVGREDRTNSERLKLSQLLDSVDRSKPIVLLDHQPYNLEEVVAERVDLQLSGHTHKGQFWPGTFLVKAFYKVAYGYRRIEESHFYVTSGLGLWGPKIRVGSRSELVVIEMHFL